MNPKYKPGDHVNVHLSDDRPNVPIQINTMNANHGGSGRHLYWGDDDETSYGFYEDQIIETPPTTRAAPGPAAATPVGRDQVATVPGKLRPAPTNDPIGPRGATAFEVDGVTYYVAVACDGWLTGPCTSADVAESRVRAYELCEEVSEAAPGQMSRAQMQAFYRWSVEVQCQDSATRVRDLIRDAIRSGLHTVEWVRASAARKLWRFGKDHPVINAGGTYVRRRLPNTAIPTTD